MWSGLLKFDGKLKYIHVYLKFKISMWVSVYPEASLLLSAAFICQNFALLKAKLLLVKVFFLIFNYKLVGLILSRENEM